MSKDQDKSSNRGRFRRGLLWAFFPTRAFTSLSEAGNTLGRSFRMLRDRKFEAPEELAPAQEEKLRRRKEQIDEGKKVVLSLEEHDRFEYFVEGLGWTAEEIESQKRGIRIGHLFRLGLLYLLIFLLPALCWRYGMWQFFYLVPFGLFLSTLCLKAACFYTQLEERALWSLKQLRARPGYWLYKRAFWFFD